MNFLSIMEGLFWWRLKWVRRSANRTPNVLVRWSLQILSWGPLNFFIDLQNFASIYNEDRLGSFHIIIILLKKKKEKEKKIKLTEPNLSYYYYFIKKEKRKKKKKKRLN